MTQTTCSADVQQVVNFLHCRTPQRWFEQALEHLPELLIDHANCEKKAAGTALSLLYRYVDRTELLMVCSRLAREELRHFEQVVQLLEARAIPYRHLSSSRYAAQLRKPISTVEPLRLVDTLLTAAVVEARSCERFLGLTAVLPEDLASFYQRLLDSEARHFQQYLHLAESYAEAPIADRLQLLLQRDAELATQVDDEFRFHSGPLGQNIPTPSSRPL